MQPEDTERSAILIDVAERLIATRVRLGYDLEAAAAAAHILPERLAEAEDATIALREDELQALADAYGVDPASFFGGRVTPFSYLAGA
jgi:transcriptional regulator with XRE-family HTH domain